MPRSIRIRIDAAGALRGQLSGKLSALAGGLTEMCCGAERPDRMTEGMGGGTAGVPRKLV
ncbi:protein of unknown function [Pararobbsia alpina]